jgi:hypothetical protein
VGLVLSNCAAPSSRVDVTVRNSLPHPVLLRARAGGFERRLSLPPGATWEGWVPPQFVSSVELEISEEKLK